MKMNMILYVHDQTIFEKFSTIDNSILPLFVNSKIQVVQISMLIFMNSEVNKISYFKAFDFYSALKENIILNADTNSINSLRKRMQCYIPSRKIYNQCWIRPLWIFCVHIISTELHLRLFPGTVDEYILLIITETTIIIGLWHNQRMSKYLI